MKPIFAFLVFLVLSFSARSQCMLTYSQMAQPETCFGTCDGSILFSYVNVGMPAPPYIVSLMDGGGSTVSVQTYTTESATAFFPALCGGSYTVVVQGMGCSSSVIVTVPQPIPVMFSADVVDDSGLSDGEITLNVVGGTAPYIFSIDGGVTFQSSNYFGGLPAGTYNAVVMDNNGCQSMQLVTVALLDDEDCVVVATAMAQPASCGDLCDGQIVYVYQNTNMSEPGAPYIVTLEDGDGNTISVQTYMSEVQTILFDDLCPDTYTIDVQGQGCNFTTTATVIAPPPLVLYVNSTDPSFGGADGTAELLVSGGTPGYTYSINGGITFQTLNQFTGLSAGMYTAVVMDANGCQHMLDFTLTDNTTCSLVVTATPGSFPTCYGSCNGTLNYMYADASGNTPYVIELVQSGVTLQTVTNSSSNGSGTFSGICAGVYFVKVTDAAGCTGQYPVTFSQPSPFLITGVTTTNATTGSANGTATISASGGTPAYTYSLDGVTYQSSNVFNNLAAGIHIAYAMDANGCIQVFTFIIQQDPGCNFNITTSVIAPLCAGACNGSIVYTFNGVTADVPFTVQLQSGGVTIQSMTATSTSASGTFTNLCAGNYSIVVTNASGCAQVSNVTLNTPAAVTLTATAVPATPGNSDGQITAAVVGGSGPYMFSIDNQTTWQASPVFTGLPAGVYIVWVADANGCVSLYTVMVTESSACNFSITTTVSSASCAYACDGIVTWSYTNSGINNPPYLIELKQGSTTLQTYESTNASASGQFFDLCEGVYTVVVSDVTGCYDEQTVYVGAPDAVQVLSVTVDNASPGGSDGSAVINVTGGTAPYLFSLDGTLWQSTNVMSGLGAGVYILYVQDANGCTAGLYCFVINEEPGCFINTTLFPTAQVSCHGACDGSLGYAYTDAGSNPPYTVTLMQDGVAVSTTTQTTTSFSGTFTNLCAGVYSVVVTNANGCNSFVSSATLAQPSEILVNVSVTDASVGSNNGVAVINATGGSGQYQYSLDGITYQSSNVFENLAAGVHIAYVQDENGCISVYTFVVAENAGCNIVLTTLSAPSGSCSGECDGFISFTFDDVNSNPPYSVILTDESGNSEVELFTAGTTGTGSFISLCAGTYTVTVSDANGCQSTNTVVISTPPYLQVTPTWVNATTGNTDGSITLNVTGGTPPYQFSLDNQVTWQALDVIENLGAGFYIIWVQDANGCMQVVCVILDDSNVVSVVEIDNTLSVYPNPTQGMVLVNVPGIQNAAVYDLSGKQMQVPSTVASNGIVLDFSTAASGMYVLEIVTLNGEILRTQVIRD